jgi:hypothetical protein
MFGLHYAVVHKKVLLILSKIGILELFFCHRVSYWGDL